MSVVVHARVVEQLTRLRLRYVAERLDAVLNDAARTEPTYLDFLDGVLRQEVDAKQRTRVAMGLKIAHFPTVKTLEDFDFKFQPSVDQRLVRELATGRFLAQAENVLIFGAPGVGKTHLAIALGRAVVEAGHSVLCTSATALLAALAKAETDGQLADRLLFYSKPKLLIIDELGYLPFERRSAHLFFQLVARRYERGSLLITTNQLVTQWGAVFGDEVLAAAILDRLLHHSHTLMIQGESYRLKQKRKAGLLGKTPSSRV
jgi:DNA replication protein DnaC